MAKVTPMVHSATSIRNDPISSQVNEKCPTHLSSFSRETPIDNGTKCQHRNCNASLYAVGHCPDRNNLEADEMGSQTLFPPISSHHTFAAAVFYKSLSTILSFSFLFIIVLASMVKTMSSMIWVLWSWCRLKDPDRARPFYEREKERRHIKTGKLNSKVGYFAERAGLECDETKIEAEDGFILTMQHIIDRNPDVVDSTRRKIWWNGLTHREVSPTSTSWLASIIRYLLLQR